MPPCQPAVVFTESHTRAKPLPCSSLPCRRLPGAGGHQADCHALDPCRRVPLTCWLGQQNNLLELLAGFVLLLPALECHPAYVRRCSARHKSICTAVETHAAMAAPTTHDWVPTTWDKLVQGLASPPSQHAKEGVAERAVQLLPRHLQHQLVDLAAEGGWWKQTQEWVGGWVAQERGQCRARCGKAQHSMPQHSTAQHSTAQHSTVCRSTAQRSTAGHLVGRQLQVLPALVLLEASQLRQVEATAWCCSSTAGAMHWVKGQRVSTCRRCNVEG